MSQGKVGQDQEKFFPKTTIRPGTIESMAIADAAINEHVKQEIAMVTWIHNWLEEILQKFLEKHNPDAKAPLDINGERILDDDGIEQAVDKAEEYSSLLQILNQAQKDFEIAVQDLNKELSVISEKTEEFAKKIGIHDEDCEGFQASPLDPNNREKFNDGLLTKVSPDDKDLEYFLSEFAYRAESPLTRVILTALLIDDKNGDIGLEMRKKGCSKSLSEKLDDAKQNGDLEKCRNELGAHFLDAYQASQKMAASRITAIDAQNGINSLRHEQDLVPIDHSDFFSRVLNKPKPKPSGGHINKSEESAVAKKIKVSTATQQQKTQQEAASTALPQDQNQSKVFNTPTPFHMK